MAVGEVVIGVADAVDRRDVDAWVYFGRQGGVRRALEASLGAERMLSAADVIDAVVARIRLLFVELDRCIDIAGRELEWDSSTLAERSPYTSGLFYDVCVVLAFVELLERDGSLAVYVDDSTLARELVRQAHARGARVVARRALMRADWRAALRPAAAYLRGALRRVTFVVEAARRRRDAGTASELAGVDVVIVTWASPSTFDDPDRLDYFGRLPALLREQGLRVAVVAQPLAWVHDWADVAAAARRSRSAVLLEDCVPLRAVVQLAWRTLTTRFRIVSPFVLDGVDLTRLLRLELLRERAGVRQLWSMQHAVVGARLARAGVGIVLHPFENQAWEKALRAPLADRGVPVVGYQHTPFSLQWLPYFPSTFDLERGALPSRVVVLGDRWLRLLVDHGYPSEVVRVGPALRFSGARAPGASVGGDVVVAAPIDEDETLELVSIVEAAAAELPDTHFLLRLHPVFDVRRLAASTQIAVASERLAELLQHAPGMVYTGTSACYEALAAGRPVISVRTELWLDTDPLPWASPARLRARGAEELAAAVRELGADGAVADDALRLLAETLQPPTGTAADAEAFVGGLLA